MALVGNLRLWTVQELVSSVLVCNRKSIQEETVRKVCKNFQYLDMGIFVHILSGRVWMICTSGTLVRELSKLEDDFIIVKDENDREYIIDSIGRTKEGLLSRICLNIRDGGTGNIRR